MKPLALLFAAALTLPVTAHADPAKPGAWKRTVDTHISDPSGALYQLPPDIVRQLRTTEGVVTLSYCMSAADVIANKIALTSADCTTGTVSVSGSALSADYTCAGNSPGRGTISITYDSPEHYTGDMLFVPKAGSKLKWKSALEGQWIGETCPAN